MSSGLSTSKNTIHFWRGVYDPRELTEIKEGGRSNPELLAKIEKVREVLTQLVNNEYSNGANIEKLRNHNIYSVRFNLRDRILFTDIKIQGQNRLLLLDVVLDHRYEGSKFLKSAVLKKFYIKQQGELKDKELDFNELPWEKTEEPPHFNGHDDSQIKFTALDYYKSKFILFDEDQEKAVNIDLPAIVNGPPGSGKTCVALSALIDYMSKEENQKGKKILYVCTSKKLVASMQQKWNEHPLSKIRGENRTTVEFKTYKEIIQSASEELNTYAKVTEEEKVAWLKRQRNIITTSHVGGNRNKKNRKKQGESSQVNLKIEDKGLIFEEFQTISTCKDVKEYKDIGGKKHHYHTPDEQEVIWNLFNKYKDWLQSEQKYDPRCYRSSQKDLYDLTVVDEAADFSPIAMMQLYNLTKNGQIAYFLDTQQDLEDSLSKRDLLKRMMHVKGVKIASIALPSVYRCPKAVVDFANSCLDMKAFLTGGIADKDEYRSVQAKSNDPGNVGEVSWCQKDITDVFTELRTKHKAVDIAIIASDKDKDKLSKELGTPLIFTPKEIKGLEYPVIILFNPFETKEFLEINKKLKGVEKKDLEGCRHKVKNNDDRTFKAKIAPVMSKLFTSVTRAEEKLVIVQKVNHETENIYSLLWDKNENTTSETSESTSKAVELPSASVASDRNQWLEQAKKLYITNSEQFNAVCRGPLNSTPESIKCELGLEDFEKDKGKEPSIQTTPSSSKETYSSKKKKRSKKGARKKQPAPSAVSLPPIPHPDENQVKAIFKTIAKGKNKVDNLLTQEVSLEVRDQNGRTLLLAAAASNNMEVMEALIDKGADVNAMDNGGRTALHLLAQLEGEKSLKDLIQIKKRSPIVELLIKRGARLDLQDENGQTPLLLFIKTDWMELSIFNLENEDVQENSSLKAAVNMRDKDGKTPLHYTACDGEDDDYYVKFLLKYGAKLDMKDKDGNTPLHSALNCGQGFFASKLIEAGANVRIVNRNGDTPILTAVKAGYEGSVKELIENGVSLDELNKEGKTALHIAVENGNTNIVKLLIEGDARLDMRDKNGQTPLMIAIKYKLNEIMQLIFSALSKQKEMSTLHAAVKEGNIEEVEKCIGVNGVVNKKDKDGKTSLHYAAQITVENFQKYEIIELLIESGAEVNVQDKMGRTPLHDAAEFEINSEWDGANKEVIEFLIKKGAEINLQDKKGKTALYISIESDCSYTPIDLKELGADLCIADDQGITPIHLIASHPQDDDFYVENLIDEFVVNVKDKDGKTPLHYSIISSNDAIFEMLIDIGADINAKDNDGKTPLHYAAEIGLIDMVKDLLRQNACLDEIDVNGKTALMLAKANNHSKVVKAINLAASEQK